MVDVATLRKRAAGLEDALMDVEAMREQVATIAEAKQVAIKDLEQREETIRTAMRAARGRVRDATDARRLLFSAVIDKTHTEAEAKTGAALRSTLNDIKAATGELRQIERDIERIPANAAGSVETFKREETAKIAIEARIAKLTIRSGDQKAEWDAATVALEAAKVAALVE